MYDIWVFLHQGAAAPILLCLLSCWGGENLKVKRSRLNMGSIIIYSRSYAARVCEGTFLLVLYNCRWTIIDAIKLAIDVRGFNI